VHAATAPSPWFVAQRERLAAAARAGPLLDLASGRGRHALAAAADGARVLAIDRDPLALRELEAIARRRRLAILGIRADLETSLGIPVRPQSCAGILVFRFLFRPLAPAITAGLAPGGLLLYETFTLAQRELGSGPRNPRFLLAPGELLALFPDLTPLAYWEGRTPGPHPECLARLLARRA
jgi:SAM-dependent methyltransferase